MPISKKDNVTPAFVEPTTPDDKADTVDDVQADADDVPAEAPALNKSAEVGPPAGDFVFVKYPDGTMHAVSRTDFNTANANAGDVRPVPAAMRPEDNEEFYVHLANGETRRVKRSDLPAAAGTNVPNGYLIDGDKAHYVTGVYPVETDHKES